MVFNHSKLIGKIYESGYTQRTLANSVKINAGTMSQKLKNKSHFTAKEIAKISEVLNISASEIGTYFFGQ